MMGADPGAASVTDLLPPVVLTIGGSDSGGGAGVQADLKTFMGLGVHGCCALSCITAQNTCGVSRVAAVEVAMLDAQVQAVLADLPVVALKTGMLLDADRITATAALLQPLSVPKVIDPVMVSRHGAVLLDPAAITALRTLLLPQATLLTPNLHEAQLLWGQPIDDAGAMERAAAAIAALGPAAVLIKGGGLPACRGDDVLWHRGRLHWFHGSAIATRHSHGSGCTLSAAITARLAHGDDLPSAVAAARAYVRRGLTWSLALGQGQGPLGHWPPTETIASFADFVQRADCSLLASLNADPEATADGDDHRARQVLSGHYVPVTPTPLPEPEWVAHSGTLFRDLGLDEALVADERFLRLFSGDISVATAPMRPFGWATGYALSIYGTEYTQQCPFGTGNGYGDGRAISVLEGVFNGRRWEMQLKGGGPTPYCRGADGRAVLRSSVREFLAQEFMHALGVPTSRSLMLTMSRRETVRRPWYAPDSQEFNPDILVDNPAAITTRVAPSFLRVGQLELFARRVRRQAHPRALEELRLIVAHLIERNYRPDIDPSLAFNAQVVELARLFRGRLTALVADWLRVGYCQGNFNSDNCAAGGYTLDYGPFGFCELFDPRFQPWTGGGEHFCFFNQPAAAEANYTMFWSAVRLLLDGDPSALAQLDAVHEGFAPAMSQAVEAMWAAKLGLAQHDGALFNDLLALMLSTKVDYTMFFRRLSALPVNLSALKESFYQPISDGLESRWLAWLQRWRGQVTATAAAMQQVSPAIAWREWQVVPAYEQAAQGDPSLVHSLQALFSQPYETPSAAVAASHDRLRPREFFHAGGVSHYSCSS